MCVRGFLDMVSPPFILGGPAKIFLIFGPALRSPTYGVDLA